MDLAGHRISCHPRADEAAVRHVLLDQVVPRLLVATGSTVLHASAVLLDGAAVLFAGRSGAGKSTLAARCAEKGHSLLGDDATVLERDAGGWRVLPGYPGLRLWPDSVDLLDADVDVRPLAAGTQKARVDVPQVAPPPAAGTPRARGHPLGAVVMIERRPGPVTARRLEGSGAFSRLWETTFTWPGTVVDEDLLDRITALATEAGVAEVGFADAADPAAILDAVGGLAARR